MCWTERSGSRLHVFKLTTWNLTPAFWKQISTKKKFQISKYFESVTGMGYGERNCLEADFTLNFI